jgi:hypothetical protein
MVPNELDLCQQSGRFQSTGPGYAGEQQVSVCATMYTTCGTNMPTTFSKKSRKIKKSFSISPESDSFIRRTCKERKSTSESETLDVLLKELMTIRRQSGIDAAYSNYYDSLSEGEVAEQSAWGTFAESQLEKESR